MGAIGGGGVSPSKNNNDDDTYMTPWGRPSLQPRSAWKQKTV